MSTNLAPGVDFTGKTVLITGGTRGIGLNLGLTFARYGAQCVLTYRWGSHSEEEIREQFSAIGARSPLLFQADVVDENDTIKLMEELRRHFVYIDIFISNVSAAFLIRSFEDYSLRALKKSISYSSWPMVNYFKQLKNVFNRYPKYTIGISSTGPDSYSYGYDFVAASKGVMEVFCRYLSYRFKEQDININVVRSRAIRTQSLRDTFGSELEDFSKKMVPDNYWIDCQEVSNVIIALCSGYCDAIRGQTITVDKGTSFFDNLMDIYTRHEKTAEKIL